MQEPGSRAAKHQNGHEGALGITVGRIVEGRIASGVGRVSWWVGYRDHSTQTGAVTFGAPDILDQVARSANAAPPTTRCTPS